MPDPTPTTPETPATTAPEAERKWFGKSPGDWILAVVIAPIYSLLLLGVGYWLNSSAPHLALNIAPPVQFQGEKTKFGIITFSVTNDGSKTEESVECYFKTQGAKAPDIKVTPAHLQPVTTIKDGEVTVKVERLHSGETINVVAYIPDVLADKPDVKVRGKGVKGEEKPATDWTGRTLLVITVTSAISCLIICGFIVSTWRNLTQIEVKTLILERKTKLLIESNLRKN